MIEERLSSGNVSILTFESMEQKEIFGKLLHSFVCDYKWCHDHGIDYLSPDMVLAKKCVYDEMSLGRKG